MIGELDFFLNYDVKFVDQPQFYLELTLLGRDTEDSLDRALSISTDYLYRLTDVDGVFQESKAACLRIAEDIMIFVNNAEKLGQREPKTWEK